MKKEFPTATTQPIITEGSPSKNFWQFAPGFWFSRLNTTADGLSQERIGEILAGKGHLRAKATPFLRDVRLFVSQFKSPLMLLLIGAIFLSAFLGDHSDVFIILFIVVSTGLLSFFQERNAGRVVQQLQAMISLKSIVLRQGQELEILSSDVLEGDVMICNAGDMIPADCLIIEANELHANEASLTGESYPARKFPGILPADTGLSKRTNCLWEGTSIVSGTARALVINTGSNTIFGSITQSAGTTVETSFEKGIRDFGFFLMKITLVLSVIILIINLLSHESVIESALFALALAVGMAPELLPAITTIAMSAGAKRMLAKRVVVKKLASIQNLGEVNLLCTDKTGTITEGSITVSGLLNPDGKSCDYVQWLAYWNARFESGYANPIDEALKKISPAITDIPEKTGEVPYDFIRKMLSIGIRSNNAYLLISKGAFDQIIGICTSIREQDGSTSPLAPHLEQLKQNAAQYGAGGLRTIAICYKTVSAGTISKTDENNMIFAGFILLEDPIKPGIEDTIQLLHKLDVKLKIITGDNKDVARSIALKIGISNPMILSGRELHHTSPEALLKQVRHTDIFAEVEPLQKELIIRALRKSFTVAYIGDGINDVSAIGAADVGISVENAISVAREAADIVLMDKDLRVLADGIMEGRKTFANTLKYIFISTGSTFGNMLSVAVASLLLPFLPMLPKQILLTNFISDFPYLTVTSDNVDAEQLRKPGKWNLRLIRSYMVIFGFHSSLFDLITFITLYYLLKVKAAEFQTGWFIESVLSELFILFIVRTHKNFFKSRPARPLFILSLIAIVFTILLPYLPFAETIGLIQLPAVNLLAMLIIVFFYILTADLLKVWFFKKHRRA